MPRYNFETLIAIINTNSRVIKKLEQRLGPIHGLGINEFLSLYYLHESKQAMSRIALADLLGLSASGVTRLLSPIEKLGLIERQINERDARLSLVKLTRAGHLKFEEAMVTSEQTLGELFAKLLNDEKESLISITNKII